MLVSVRVKTKAPREEIVEHNGRLEISVREARERNEANRRVTAIIARHFGVRVADVRIVKGHRTPSKVFSIPD